MPGFIEKAEELKAKGVQEILCISGTIFSFYILDMSAWTLRIRVMFWKIIKIC